MVLKYVDWGLYFLDLMWKFENKESKQALLILIIILKVYKV